ncbi:MAG TPA: hypothetical protein VF236_01265 [Gaiellaceae bacterium]
MTEDQNFDRLERAARNQALFRQVNERLQELATTFQAISDNAMFACECADLKCIARIEMSLDEYEAVRGDPNQFMVLPGHVYSDVEDVIRESDRFLVVAKIGKAGAIAESRDPRS